MKSLKNLAVASPAIVSLSLLAVYASWQEALFVGVFGFGVLFAGLYYAAGRCN